MRLDCLAKVRSKLTRQQDASMRLANAERKRALEQDSQAIRRFWEPAKPAQTLLLIAHEISPSGASLLLLSIAKRLVERGYRIMLLVNRGGHLWQEGIQSLPEEVMVMPCAPASDESCVYLQTILASGVRWCIANTVIGGLFLPELSAYGFRTISLIHEMSASCRILHAEPLIRAICEHAEHIVFPAELVRDSCLGFADAVPMGKVHIIPQGNYKEMPDFRGTVVQAHDAIRAQYGLPENAWLMIGAGAINFGKGVDLLVPILCALKQQEEALGRQIHVLWMGQPRGDAYEFWLTAQIKAAGIEDRWHWCGFIHDDEEYARYLWGSDAYAMVSREDSFPAVITEALHARLPILAFSGSGGGAELLEQHEWGYVVPSGDIAAYCDRAVWLIQHREEAAVSAERAKEESRENFIFNNYLDRLLAMMRVISTEEDNHESET